MNLQEVMSTPTYRALTAIRNGDMETLEAITREPSISLDYLQAFFEMATEKGSIPAMGLLAGRDRAVLNQDAYEAAVKENQQAALEWLLAKNVPVNRMAYGKLQSPPLFSAIAKNNLLMVKLLIEHGAEFNSEYLRDAKDETLEYLQSLKLPSDFEKCVAQGLMGGVATVKLPGEFEYYAAVVENLADNSLKLKYAEWLDAQGDRRGKYLRKLVTASESMEVNQFPAPIEGAEQWTEMMGATILKGIALQRLSASRDSILRLARSAVHWECTAASDDEIPIGASKSGGLPDLPPDIPWPRGCDCPPSGFGHSESEDLCEFHCQLNLGDFRPLVAGRRLPSHGLLQFFTYIEEGQDVEGIRVLYHPDLTKLNRTLLPKPLPDGRTVDSPSVLTFYDVLSLPSKDAPWADEFGLPKGTDYELPDQSDVDFLGYMHSANSDDGTPGKEWQHLLEFSTDFQRWYLQIKQDDLLAARFDQVKLIQVEFQE